MDEKKGFETCTRRSNGGAFGCFLRPRFLSAFLFLISGKMQDLRKKHVGHEGCLYMCGCSLAVNIHSRFHSQDKTEELTVRISHKVI